MPEILAIQPDDQTKARWMVALALAYGHLPPIRYIAARITAPYHGYQLASAANALVDWTRSHIRYVREAGEQLQTPLQTLRSRIGDCDDLVIFVAAMATAIGIPWRYRWIGRPARHVVIDLPKKGGEWTTYELTRSENPDGF